METKKKLVRHCCICQAVEIEGQIVGSLEDVIGPVKEKGGDPSDYYNITSTILSKKCYEDFYQQQNQKFKYDKCIVGGDSNGIGMEKLETRAPGGY